VRLTIKLGGSLLEEEATRQPLLVQIAALRASHEILLVHGGGKRLSRRLEQLGIPARFVGGLRVTDEETLWVAVMVLAGEVNKGLVAELGGLGVPAIGICGMDGFSVRCVPLAQIPGAPAGLGFVGKPAGADSSFFTSLIGAGLMPVVASIALGPDHRPYNVNADQMASACAAATASSLLIYLTDVGGILDRQGRVIPSLTRPDIVDLRQTGVVSGGMLPKTEACLDALDRGVGAVCILPGTDPEMLAKAVDGSRVGGTWVYDAF
jgi:acetylglutamate kinase